MMKTGNDSGKKYKKKGTASFQQFLIKEYKTDFM